MIYKYRVYDAVRDRTSDLHARSRELTTTILDGLGMNVIDFFPPEVGGRSDRLIYLLALDDLAHCDQAWEAFRSNAKWRQIKQESETGGPTVARITSAIPSPTDDSPQRGSALRNREGT